MVYIGSMNNFSGFSRKFPALLVIFAITAGFSLAAAEQAYGLAGKTYSSNLMPPKETALLTNTDDSQDTILQTDFERNLILLGADTAEHVFYPLQLRTALKSSSENTRNSIILNLRI